MSDLSAQIKNLNFNMFNNNKTQRYIYNYTALHLAVLKEDKNLCIQIINIYPKIIHLEENSKHTPLHFAVMTKNLEICKFLIENGANVDSVNNNNLTPLNYVCKHIFSTMYMDKYELCKLLVDHEADVDISDNTNNTPLNYAFRYLPNYSEITHLFIENLKNVEHRNSNYTYLHHAVDLELYNCVDLLLEKGADVNSKTEIELDTPLHIAIMRNNVLIVDLLLKKNPDVNLQNNEGNTPLHVMRNTINPILFELLLEKNPNVNLKNNEGNTPLHIAVMNNYSNLVKLLFSKNPDLTIKNNEDNTPRNIAVMNNNTVILAIFGITENQPKKSIINNAINVMKFQTKEFKNTFVYPTCVINSELTVIKNKILRDKLIKICSEFNKTNPIKIKDLSLQNSSEIIEIVIKNKKESEALKTFLLEKQKPLFFQNLNIKYTKEEGVGLGVTEYFFTKCASQLKELLFDNKGELKLELELKENTKMNLVTFGYLMGLYLLNKRMFDFDISLKLLYYCIYKTNPMEDPAYIYLLFDEIKSLLTEFDNSAKANANATANPTANANATANAKISTIITNLNNISKEYGGTHFDIPITYKYVMYGFNEIVNIGHILKAKNISPLTLKETLCKTVIDIKEFIKEQLNFSNIDEEHQQWFKNILKELDDIHKKKLFYLWSSTNYPKIDTKYSLIQGNQKGYFESHTCFNQLAMPINIDSEEKLKETLIGSINMSNNAVSRYGGSKSLKSKNSVFRYGDSKSLKLKNSVSSYGGSKSLKSKKR